MKGKLTSALLIILYTSCFSLAEKNSTTKIPEKWGSLNDLQGNWTNIERDSIGYLLYHPCDGQNPGIIISNDSLIFKPQLEEPTVLPIDHVSITKDSITINTTSDILTGQFIFKLVEPNADYILFKWNYPEYQNSGKLVITRDKLSKDLRNIENPCENGKIPEHKFLAVEYD